MRGRDLINGMLPDEALMEIMKYGDGRSSDRDACALVCRRWLTLGATGQSDACLARMLQRFSNLRQVCVDERLPVPLPSNRRFPHRHTLCSRIMRPFLVGVPPISLYVEIWCWVRRILNELEILEEDFE
jgi:hypothetical protein